MEYWMNCQHLGLYEVYFNTLIWTWMWASGNWGSHDGNKHALVTVNFRKRAEQGTTPRAVVPFLVGELASRTHWSLLSWTSGSCVSNDGNNTLILLWDWNSGNREATTTAEYELDQIGVTEGIQMSKRHGPERNRQPVATRKAVTATIYQLSHDGNKTCNRGSSNNSNTQISEREFSQSSRTRINPVRSSTLPSRPWTSGR